MILDFTRKPIVLLPTECTRSVVVRSLHSGDIDGLLYGWNDWGQTRTVIHSVAIQPTVTVQRGSLVYMETRLPLPQFQSEISTSPYEVASGYKDTLTGYQGSHRLAVQVEHSQKQKLWFVTVFEVGINSLRALLSVADPHLESVLGVPEVLPLTRMARKLNGTEPQNFWEKLNNED